jgi:hypothetical protein
MVYEFGYLISICMIIRCKRFRCAIMHDDDVNDDDDDADDDNEKLRWR